MDAVLSDFCAMKQDVVSPLSRTPFVLRISLFGLCLAAVTMMPITARADDDAGKAVFTAKGCPECHAVSSHGIKSDGDAADLSKIGSKHDAATIEKFITKQVELNGKKHKKKYQGSDDDLKKLVSWLASLK